MPRVFQGHRFQTLRNPIQYSGEGRLRRRYIADVMIGFLQDMLAYMLQTFLSQERLPHADVLLDQLPAPLFEGNTADQLEKCILDDDFKNLVFGNQVTTDEGWEGLPFETGAEPFKCLKG